MGFAQKILALGLRMTQRVHITTATASRLLAASAVAVVCAWIGASAAAPASADAGGAQLAAGRAPVRNMAVRGSVYPKRAEYPRKLARPSEFAHNSSSAGGVSPGTSAPAKAVKKKASMPKPRLHGNPARALVAYQAMQKNFYIPGTGLYQGEPYSYLWPFSQALTATISVSNIAGQARAAKTAYPRELHVRMYGLGKYWSPPGTVTQPLPGEQPEEEEIGGPESSEVAGIPPPTLPSYNGNVVPPGGVSYYDDNEWIGIELARLYKLHHEPAALEKAEQIMAFVMSGWQTSPKLACPGGVPFSDSPSNTDRNTVTDGPAAELGVQLYRITGNGAYLQFAVMAYEWVRHCLMSQSGLYFDHIRPRGVIGQALWSYNQGSMIGAGALLYEATGDAGYLYEARQTAKAALSYFTIQRLLGENPFFPAVYFRNLMYLDAITHDPPGSRLAQTYVDSVWVHQRLTNGLFVFGSPPGAQLLTQAAMAQIYALLSTPANTFF